MKKTFIALFFLIPLSVSALSVADIEAQIQSIRARIAVLYAELARLGAATTTPPLAYTLPSLPCLSLSRDLAVSSRGEDVRQLQLFLIKAGVLGSDSATGYFGALTEVAVQKFQSAYVPSSQSSGNSEFGVVGAKTREAIFANCYKKETSSGSKGSPLCEAAPLPSTRCEGIWQRIFAQNGCIEGYRCSRIDPNSLFSAGAPGEGTEGGSGKTGGKAIAQKAAPSQKSAPSPSSGNFPTSTAAAAGTCLHDGYSYPHGTTISVPCEAGSCLSETSGYITATCSIGKWCIPSTNYCAASIRDISVTSYRGGGATSIGTGGTLNCPQVGWRVYLNCALLQGCKTGWNVCTAGGWAYDSDQTVR